MALVLVASLYVAQGLYYARVLVPVHDAIMYLLVGAKAVRGEVSPFDDRIVGHRSPLPFYVLGLTQLAGPDLLTARWLNVGFGLLTVLLTAAVARRLAGDLAAILAALFLATQGVVVAYYSYEGYPAFSAFCFMTAVYVVAGSETRSQRILGMTTVALLFFVRSNLWPAIPFFLAYALWRARDRAERLQVLAVVSVPLLVFFAEDSRHLKILAYVPFLRRLVAPLGYVSVFVLGGSPTLSVGSQIWEIMQLLRRYEFWMLAMVLVVMLAGWRFGVREAARRATADRHVVFIAALFVYMLAVQLPMFAWNVKWVGVYFIGFAPLVPLLLGVGFAALIRDVPVGSPAGWRMVILLACVLVPPIYFARNPLMPIGDVRAKDPFAAAHRAGEHLRQLVPPHGKVFFYGLNTAYYLSRLPQTYLQQVYLPDQFAHAEAEDWVLRRSGFVPASDMRLWLSRDADYAVIDTVLAKMRTEAPGPESEMMALIARHFEQIGTVNDFPFVPYAVFRRKPVSKLGAREH